MLVRMKKIVTLGVMALVAAVISLPVVSLAATSPSVSVLSPMVQGLRAPVKMVLDAEGNAYVADQRVGGVVKLNVYGVPVMTIRTEAAPAGLAFAQDGTLLVSQASFVAGYDVATGQEVGRLTGGQLQYPVGVAVDDVTGFVYVADSRANQIEVYTASGNFVKAFGKGMAADASGKTVMNPVGKLSMPSGISFEKVSRQLVVADTLSSRVQFFDVDGNFVKSIGNAVPTALGGSVGPMQFFYPVAVAFEYSKGQTPALSRMYVVDSFQGNVQVVDPATASALNVVGTAKNYIGSVGVANGQLMTPNDAVFDAINNRLLVVNGFGNITAYGIDGGKNPIYVDVTPPVFTVNQIPAEVMVNSLAFGGTVEAGSSVQVTSGGTAVVGTVTYSGSAWSVDVSGLAIGNNSFTVSAKDAAGNSAAPQTITVNYVLPAPAVTISATSAITKNTVLTVTGTVDSGSSVVVTNQTTSVSGSALVSGATWSYVVNLVDGVNTLNVSAQIAQSAKSTASVSVTLDTTAPVLSVSALANGSYTSTPVQNISGTVTDLHGAAVTVNGVAAVLTGNAFSVPVTLLNGSNLISIVAVDAAGNAVADNRTLIFDAAKPVVAIAVPVDNSFTSNATLVINGSVNIASTVTVAGVPAVVEGNNWSATVELVPGVNTIEVVATDLSGSSSSVKRSITFDSAKPVLAVMTPVQDVAVNVPNVLISGTVSDTTATTVEYAVNGSTPLVVPVTAGTYSFNVDFAAEGNYPVTVTAKDAAGNVSTIVRTVIYDMTPPSLTLAQVNGVMPVKLSGTVEAGSSVVVKDGSLQVGSVVVANGSWTADLAGVMYSPDALLVIATDAAGNSTSKTITYSFPDGTLNANSKPTVQDALRAIRIVVNGLTPTAQELAHYDIGPLVGGKPNPNGKIEIVDAILILRKALGLKSW